MITLKQEGNEELLKHITTLFLSSKHTPLNLYHYIFQWTDSLTENDCIACFNSTVMESEVLKALLVRHIPTVLFVMNRFTDENNIQIQHALKENRLLIVTLRRNEPKGEGYTPVLRNKYVMTLCPHITCGYINKKGSIFPLLKGKKEVCHLIKEPIVSEEKIETPSKRWTVSEEKTLLRMFYADMGIHAIHKDLQRSYLSIDQKIRSITQSEDVMKGRLFEDFVLDQFETQKKGLSLVEWRSDKSWNETYPESNRYPDFVFRYKQKEFAVECKWRERIYDIRNDLFHKEQISIYRSYSLSRNIPVTIVLGIGGEPSWPEVLYLIPLKQLDEILSGTLSISKKRTTSLDISSFL